jgi:hypothetical protein
MPKAWYKANKSLHALTLSPGLCGQPKGWAGMEGEGAFSSSPLWVGLCLGPFHWA